MLGPAAAETVFATLTAVLESCSESWVIDLLLPRREDRVGGSTVRTRDFVELTFRDTARGGVGDLFVAESELFLWTQLIITTT